MEELYNEFALSNSRLLCIGPITQAEATEGDAPFCDGLGCYLYTADASNPSRDIAVIARFLSMDAAVGFGRLLRSALGSCEATR
jgi:hypothetical protein